MKKILSILLIGLIMYSLCACASSSPSANQEESGCSHYWRDATCTEAKVCNFCGETSGKALGHQKVKATCTEAEKCTRCDMTFGVALGHTTSSGKCDRCGVSFSKWEKRYYTDEFNNPTSNAFIAPIDTLSGTFSNSATTNSKLSAYIRVNSDDCEIMLWEYGSSMVKAYSTTDYDITLLLPNGTKKYFTGKMYKNGIAICFDDYSGIISLLKNTNGVISIYIKEDSKYGVNSTYLFEVNTSGFKDLYNNTFLN